MKLSQLLEGFATIHEDCDITGLSNDSRCVKPGDCFLAYKGLESDGRHYISQAMKHGARAVVYDDGDGFLIEQSSIVSIAVANLASKLGGIANRYYSEPSASLKVTGITGTNGKTTIAYMLAQAHELLGQKAAYIGTLGVGRPNEIQAGQNTTPDSLILQELLACYRAEKLEHVVMEVSSHALAQGRVEGTAFRHAIFTNLSHEHLDYHQTMQAYGEAKSLLFRCPSLKTLIINGDDEHHLRMLKDNPAGSRVITYGFGDKNDVVANELELSLAGMQVNVSSPWGEEVIESSYLGRFNAYNLMAVFISLMVEGYELSEVLRVIKALPVTTGRMECVHQRPCVIVDYAHTPDALAKALETLKEIVRGKLICVFGCGGDRDRDKRRMMGKVATDLADCVIVTNDNPRFEASEKIIDDISQGFQSPCDIAIEPDRFAAIKQALSKASPEDVILIAGKGHETVQLMDGKKAFFSDSEAVKRVIRGH